MRSHSGPEHCPWPFENGVELRLNAFFSCDPVGRGSQGLASPSIGVIGCCFGPFCRASGYVCDIHGDS